MNIKLVNKIIFVIDDTTSRINQSIIVASIAQLLSNTKLKINIIKIYNYLNIHTTNLNTSKYEQIYLTSDGLITDFVLGYYEKFTDIKITKDNIITLGQVYQTIINNKEKSEYLDKTIQIIPYITNEIIKLILKNSDQYDITICEISDINSNIESMIYMEVIRQLKVKFSNQICIILLTYILFLEKSKKFKTKLAKYSINSLLDFGIKADFIFCKYDKIISKIDFIDKIALYSNIYKNRIF